MSLGTVLVTGGASGLGAAVVAAVTADGGRPVVLDRVAPDAEVEHEIVDLADTRSAEATVRAVAERVGGLDAVVTCAGTDACGRLDDVPGEDWDRVVLVNLLGTVAVVRAAMPGLLERRGRVVTVASTLGLRALSDATAYCASKFGVVGLVQSLARELGPEGIRVSAVAPGLVDTEMLNEFFSRRADSRGTSFDEVAATALADVPLGRLATPTEVADAIVFLVSDQASYLSGIVLPILGGELSG